MNNKDLIQDLVLSKLDYLPHGILELSPRFGKTLLTIKLIARDAPKKVLWVTPSTKLRDEDIPNEFKNWGYEEYLKKVDIICYSSLHKQEGNYDLIVLDEIQFVTLSNTENLFKGKLKYESILGLTGTLSKNEEKIFILDKLDLEVLDSVDIDKAIDLGLVAPYEVIKLAVPLNATEKNVKAGSKAKPFYQTELSNYNYLTQVIEDYKAKYRARTAPMYMYLNRMRFIYNAKSKQNFAKKLLKELKGRTLVFTGSIENAEYISYNTYHSKRDDKCLKQFINGEIDHLVCVNSGGVGYTFKNIDNVIIVQSDSNKNGNTLQKLARALVPRENYTANIYMLYLKDTVDEDWVDMSLASLDTKKIKIATNYWNI